MPTYEEKLAKLKGLVEDFNNGLPLLEKLKWDAIEANIKKAGAFNDATLALLTESDLMEAGLPKLLARSAVSGLTVKTSDESGPQKPYVTAKKAAQMTVQQLVEAFDPQEADNAVGERLAGMVGTKPFVVFSDEISATVAVAETVANLNAIRDGYPAREFVTYKGVPTKTYRVGERPFDLADENPLFIGQPLLPPEQTCTITNRSWAKAPLKLRQLLRLACQTGEFRNTTENAHNVLDVLDETENPETLFTKWGLRYPRAALRYKELEQQSLLPTLKIARGGYGVTAPQDPFSPGHRRV